MVSRKVNNAREDLSLLDQQEQLRDCWEARAGLPEPERVAAVCADLGISARKVHNLRRQLSLPDPIRARVAERPTGEQLSVTMANRLADMHQVAPKLTEAVANRITSSDLHEKAQRDLGGFVHRAKTRALKVRITPEIRDRARAGRYAFVHERGQDFAAGIWVVDPAFIIDLAREALQTDSEDPAREEAFFTGAQIDDAELRDAAEEDRQRKQNARLRQAEATRTNLGLGHDIRAGLIDPTAGQLHALKEIVCRLLTHHYRELIAYGAGWTDQDRQQLVGDSGRHEPRHIDAILDAELERALADPDALRGIAQLAARWAAAFVLDPDGVTRTKALGTERMNRKVRDALAGGDSPLRTAVWEFLRPMLSPTLVALNHDAFIVDHSEDSTVDLDKHRSASDLDELDLDDSNGAA